MRRPGRAVGPLPRRSRRCLQPPRPVGLSPGKAAAPVGTDPGAPADSQATFRPTEADVGSLLTRHVLLPRASPPSGASTVPPRIAPENGSGARAGPIRRSRGESPALPFRGVGRNDDGNSYWRSRHAQQFPPPSSSRAERRGAEGPPRRDAEEPGGTRFSPTLPAPRNPDRPSSSGPAEIPPLRARGPPVGMTTEGFDWRIRQPQQFPPPSSS